MRCVDAQRRLEVRDLSFRLSKDTLRVRTLARLSGVSARDIEKGRLKRDSSEWKKIEQSGKQASP